jgi:hypothetical protein
MKKDVAFVAAKESGTSLGGPLTLPDESKTLFETVS